MSSTFHLHNARINQELDIILNGKRLRHDNRPTYLGVTLTARFTNPHLRKAAAKTLVIIFHMLAGTTWGAGAKTFEHQPWPSVTLWLSTVLQFGGIYTQSFDVQLNNTITITGLRCTRTDWLPVLATLPLYIRREFTSKISQGTRQAFTPFHRY